MLTIPFVPSFLVGMANAHSFTPVGDITVIGLSILTFILLMQTSINKDRSFRILTAMLIMACVSSTTDIGYQMYLSAGTVHIAAVYLLRAAHHVSLSVQLYLNLLYLQDPLWITANSRRRFTVMPLLTLILAFLLDILGTITGTGFRMDGDGTVTSGFNVYIIVFAMMTIGAFYLILRYRGRVIRQVFWGLLSSHLLSYLIMLIQGFFHQTSFTGVAYFFPLLGIVFMFHSNPFDLNTGGASDTYLYHELGIARDRKRRLVLMSCRIVNFNRVIADSKEFKYEYYQFFRQNVRRGVLYRLENDRLVLTFPKGDEEAQAKIMDKMLESFRTSHAKFNIDYKIVIMETDPEIQSASDYIRILETTERNMPYNTVHRIDEQDIRRFYSSSYILSELEDIVQRRDLNDPRVLVYCQPVFNIHTNTYDTAEALMRLKLPKTGMVYPDQFIPLAEQYGHIHTLSMIILNKTCAAIRTLIEENIEIGRISVNFSTLDIRYDSFCQEVQQIISRNQIPYNKIAIEITESRNEADFNIMKGRVQELQKLGIMFYLDDFGTGYSNFERIMEIPFDIIKFDRSMTIESAKSRNSFYMVSTFANMFSELHYSILFEGVEDEHDEQNCVKMSAKYLQGFKYSKPIPIEDLVGFLETRKAS